MEHSDAYLSLSNESDKYLILYTLMKLELISGKIIIFTNTVSTGYKLKLYLEQFHMNSLMLNYEHPKSTRHLSISNFVNKNQNILIIIDPDEEESMNKGTKRHRVFKVPINVVVNFDCPSSRKLYKMRLADLESKGNSNVSIFNLILENELKILNRINRYLERKGRKPIEELTLKIEEFQKFRYRCQDVLNSVSEKKIKNARVNDVKKAILAVNRDDITSQDKKLLQKAKKKNKTQKHLKHVPEYLLPDKLKHKNKEKTFQYNKQLFENQLARREKRPPREFLPDETIEENPEQIHYKDLPITSNRKLWKIRHHKAIHGKPKKKQKRL